MPRRNDIGRSGFLTGRTLGRCALVVLIFVLAGPPVGAVTMSLLGGTLVLIDQSDTGTGAYLFQAGLAGLVFSWLVGWRQALVAGIVFVGYAAWKGRSSILLPAIAGVLAGLPRTLGEGGPVIFTMFLVFAHVSAALFCGLLARRYVLPHIKRNRT